MSPLVVIAQGAQQPAPARSGSVGEIVLWVAVVMALFVVGAFVLAHLRKTFLGGDDEHSETDTVSLHTLKRMRAEGRLSEQEYEKAAAVVLKMSPGSNPIRDEIERRASERERPPQ